MEWVGKLQASADAVAVLHGEGLCPMRVDRAGGGGRQGGFLGGELNSKEDCADAWLAQGSTGQCSGYPELF